MQLFHVAEAWTINSPLLLLAFVHAEAPGQLIVGSFWVGLFYSAKAGIIDIHTATADRMLEGFAINHLTLHSSFIIHHSSLISELHKM
jgi:hypothetical protein